MTVKPNSHNKTSMQRTLYSDHLSIVGIILRFQLTLPPRTDLCSGHVQYQIFLARNLYTVHFGQCFAVSFKFSLIFVILLFNQFNGLFSSMKMQGLQICRNFQSVFISMVGVFSRSKDTQSTMGQEQKYGYNHENFCFTQTTTSPLQ